MDRGAADTLGGRQEGLYHQLLVLGSVLIHLSLGDVLERPTLELKHKQSQIHRIRVSDLTDNTDKYFRGAGCTQITGVGLSLS